jgi:hypothetical protein
VSARRHARDHSSPGQSVCDLAQSSTVDLAFEKRATLMKRISDAAKASGLTWTQVASKANHEKWRLGTSV